MKNYEQQELGNSKARSRRSYGLRGLKRRLRDVTSIALLRALSTVLGSGETARYESVGDGDRIAVNVDEQGLNLACCDCALVHYINFEVVDRTLIMTFWRNEEETEICRADKNVEVEFK